ncbi:sigma-70 family RNA polymerase sigma factor [Micromonospora narathiwatensis]|uniref:RNA polymerase sigma-70 factor, ECF subfamily n=1 Tax=Micromonospora narathiwatensis TaxID=299146 RepID=A0A1A8Z496_9ACTN|nr:sigma-70 family RNA polymerase sigma factor [Micromonospora narathiwatensis]SBT38603.1 RNA polymerase sigma-70 factor, ECF subfamily [Micromonospora narathiwatensis]
MHAVAAGWHGEGAAPEWTFARAQPQSRASRSGRGVDARSGGRQNDPVTPRPAPGRHQATSTEASHSDQLIRLLYAEHAGPLLMFVMRLTGGDRQRAEDIVQETLLRAWRNAHRLGIHGQGSLRPWLVTVARRIAIDEHRSEQARPAETYDRDLTAFAEADSTDRVLRTMTVADALRTLSQSHREILVATYFRGRTVPEAAEELGLPLGTAKSRVYYALRALRTALQDRGVTG